MDEKTKKILIYTAVGMVALYLIMRLKNSKKTLFAELQREPEKSELTELIDSDQSGQIQGAATISNAEATSIAQQIKGAWGVLNDDEEAIYTAFRRIRTLADLLLVTEKYGYYKPNALLKSEDLAYSLRSRLSKSELQKVNEILAERRIDYAF